MFIDTHAHLDYPDYLEKDSKSIQNIIDEAYESGVEKIITISASPESLSNTKKIAEKFENIFFTQGIHPSYEKEYQKKDLLQLEANIKDYKCLAIGEIGLDFHYEPFDKDKQLELFYAQLDIAVKYNKFVIIHSRDAEKEIYDIMKNYYTKLNGFEVHSYTGSKETLSKFLELGSFVSFNGILTFKNAKNIHSLAEFVPIDRILLETDAPYLAPTPYRGKTNYPKYIPIIAEQLAVIKKMDIKNLKNIIEKNTYKAFNIC